MSKTDRSGETTGRNSNEGTAARTRPLSFEEIMSRRKKKLTADVKERVSETRESSEKGNAGGALAQLESDGGHKSTYDSKDKVKVKENSKKMEDQSSKREGEHFEDKDTGNCDPQSSIKVKSSYSKSSRDKESKSEKYSHRNRTSNRSAADSERELNKKRPKSLGDNDKHEEKDRKSGREAKRKHHGHADDRSRIEIKGSNSKKQDSSRMRDIEYSERRDRRKEHSQTYYEEPRSQRRRCRPQEHDGERDRSVSVSPRSHKRPYHGRDYEDSSFHAFKDKPRRKYSDADMFRTSGNGGYSSGHYRKRGSGLGGYSPRKRRTDAAVKTPSPTARSPERKSTTWDQPPAGTGNAGSGSVLANFQAPASKMLELVSTTSVPAAASKLQPEPSLETRITMLNSSMESVQLTHATRPMRRLYLENLPTSASDKSVMDCLNDFLLSSGVKRIQGAKPCISCIINKEKCQALVEFLTPEDATAALSFDGRSFSGSILKIRRPKDYVEAASGAQEKPVPVVKTISDVVKDSPHKIFIGGISEFLSSEMLMEIVSAFGLLRSYHFEFNEELNGPCAFLEYEDHSITLKACAGLNGMKLGGHILTAVQALPDSYGEEEDAEKTPFYGIPEHAKPLFVDSTQVLQLKNVFNHEELLLLSEPELEETLEDIRLECARFGTIKSVNVVRGNSHCEGSMEVSAQHDPVNSANSIETRAESPWRDTMQNGEAIPSHDTEEIQDVREDKECTHNSDEKATEDFKNNESSDPSLMASAEDLPGGPHYDVDKGLNAAVEGSGVGSELLSEMPIKEEIDLKLVEFADSYATAVGKPEVSNGCVEHVPVESKSDEADTKSNGDGHCQANDHNVIEPGCILVEYIRKESAYVAAHCLHGRSYGERIVSISYIPHDIYLARFPR